MRGSEWKFSGCVIFTGPRVPKLGVLGLSYGSVV
ncbi:MAG: hypothetical protein RJA70_2844, partial [Pseudomonadota bacterium]